MSASYIGRIVREARQQANLKQDTLAQAIGCTDGYIGHIERGHMVPSLAMAHREPERAFEFSSN